MRRQEKTARRRAGFVTVYIAFATFTLIPMAGLAIDFSVLYNVKSRLQLACDAAVIGAGSEVQRSTNVNDPTQNASLKATVLRFFNANFSPAPWTSTKLIYKSTITQDPTTKIRSIFVTATYSVPMLFMRVLHINNSQVGASATANIRFVNMMIVVDRSGSVQRVGSPDTITTDLLTFVATPLTSIFVDGRDVVGLLSFGGSYNLDFAPITNFQTASPNISTAINNINFDNNSTNTGEGLYQGWYQLTQLNQVGALNVILLLTDGRPSALTGSFSAASAPHCTDKTAKLGFIDSPVNDGNPWQFPPPSSRGEYGVLNVTPECSGSGCESSDVVTNNAGCLFRTDSTQVAQDIFNIPAMIGPITHTTGSNLPWKTTFPSATGFYTPLPDSNVSDAVSVRYAAFNYADNVATAIRTDTTYSPVIYCIGLNFDTAANPNEEPLDADWLARVANDPNYKNSVTGLPVFQAGQTPGAYYNVTYSGLAAALANITGQILRLAQ